MDDANKWFNEMSEEEKVRWNESYRKHSERLNNMTSTEACIYFGLV